MGGDDMSMAYQHGEALPHATAAAPDGAPEDEVIEALAHAETSAPMRARDLAHLVILGVAVPVALLVWGWT